MVAGNSDTISSTDCGNAVIYSSASAVTVSVAQVGVNVPAYCTIQITDEGAGGVTLNGNTSTIGGAASYSIPTGGTPLSPKFVVLNNDAAKFRVGAHS